MRVFDELPSSSASVVQHCLSRMPRIDPNRLAAAVSASANRESVIFTGSSPNVDGNGYNVCRNLFGPIDHEKNAKFLNDQLSYMNREACQRWNFDFENETPIAGRYEWTPVLVEPRSLPTNDNSGEVAVNDLTEDSKVKKSQDNESSSVSFCHLHPHSTSDTQQREVKVCKPVFLQTKVTDFMPKQKRSFRDSDVRLNRTSEVHGMKRPKLQEIITKGKEAERNKEEKIAKSEPAKETT